MNFPEIPEDDSPDLTDEEVERAVLTSNTDDLSRKVVADLRGNPGTQLETHELRRRKPHLYWRVKLKTPTGEDRSIIFQADWLQQG
jgi:hypothetical protein